jgi:hypothetical protein
MLSDPGSKFDFGTLIAYLIPGYIAEFVLFAFIDSIKILLYKVSFLDQVSWDAVTAALAGALLTLLAYMLGLILDMMAHPITLKNELKQKNLAYQRSASNFRGILKNAEIKNMLRSSKDDILDTAKRDLFIDSMYYRLATPEIWARQNWHWAFYEFSRQMHLLCIPASSISAFYATLLVSFKTFPKLGITSILLVSLGVTVLISLLNWFVFRPLLKKANDTDCEVYYRHRAWVVFSYLIENEYFGKTAEKEG